MEGTSVSCGRHAWVGPFWSMNIPCYSDEGLPFRKGSMRTCFSHLQLAYLSSALQASAEADVLIRFNTAGACLAGRTGFLVVVGDKKAEVHAIGTRIVI